MDPFVDVAFAVQGKSVPLDHGYLLFSALSHELPRLHQESKWGVHPVYGKRAGPGELTLLPQSAVSLRVPQSAIGELLTLVGKKLSLGAHHVSLGAPRIFPLQPRPTLKSRFVTVKKFHEEPAPFADALRRQLDQLGVGAAATVSVGERRVQKIAEHTVVGFAVGLDGLSPDESVAVQTSGLGGRRHMGAGLFLPIGRSS